jgi:hypothetical protein
MSARVHVLNLHADAALELEPATSKPAEIRAAKRCLPKLMADLAHPDVFEFAWKGAGIEMDGNARTYYPNISAEEIAEASLCPLPHERMWVEIEVPTPFRTAVRYVWPIQRHKEDLTKFTAHPLVVRDNSLVYFGATLVVPVGGGPGCDRETGGVVHSKFASYARTKDMTEFHAQIRLLQRFFRILTLPGVEVDEVAPTSMGSATRFPQDSMSAPSRRIVTIDERAIRPEKRDPADGHLCEPRREHHRRAHLRRLPSGRTVPIRNCIVNRGVGTAQPQSFLVKR